jgi:uncharacterized protein YjbJ (UPF0337 family)
MKGKLTMLLGGAVGYVLGSRAGRERYEQIKAQARSLARNPKVRETASHAQDYAKAKAPDVAHKVTEATSKVTGRSSDDPEGARDTLPPETHPDTQA